jgi:hypothetical protein
LVGFWWEWRSFLPEKRHYLNDNQSSKR